MNVPFDQFLSARCERNPVGDSISIYLFNRLPNGRIRIATEIVFQEIDATQAITINETIAVSYQTAQEIIDSLWDCGLRPSEGSGSAGALKATENHLKDSQTILNRLLTLVEKQSKND